MDITKYAQYVMLGGMSLLLFLASVLFYMYELKIDEIAKLEAEKQILKDNQASLLASIEKQNALIKELEVKETLIDNSELLKIEVRDDTCEAELKAYKSLFKELGK